MNTAKMLPGPVLGTWFDGVLFEEFVLDDGGLVVPEVELDELVEPEVDFDELVDLLLDWLLLLLGGLDSVLEELAWFEAFDEVLLESGGVVATSEEL